MRFLSEYTGRKIPCSCGRCHAVRTRDVRVGTGAVRDLPEVLEQCGFSGPGVIVFDGNTRRVAGESIRSVLDSGGWLFRELVLPGVHVHASSDQLSRIRSEVRRSGTVRWCLAVGSGSINDLVKLAAFEEGLPYVVVGTAASMDGFLSANAAILENGVKKQYAELEPPLGAVMDTELLKTAPSAMTLSGLGDALGKFTSLAEWKLNHLCANEFYCPETAALVRREVSELLTVAEHAPRESGEFFDALVRTLLVTGIAMQMLGNSTPASGGEHYISHALDVYGFAVSGDSPSTHGLQVALGTRVLFQEYERFFREGKGEFSLLPDGLRKAHINDWKRIGVDLAPMIHAKREFLSLCRETLPNVESSEMRLEAERLLSLLPRMDAVFRSTGLPDRPGALGISDETFEFARTHAVDLRKRLTLLDFCGT